MTHHAEAIANAIRTEIGYIALNWATWLVHSINISHSWAQTANIRVADDSKCIRGRGASYESRIVAMMFVPCMPSVAAERCDPGLLPRACRTCELSKDNWVQSAMTG